MSTSLAKFGMLLLAMLPSLAALGMWLIHRFAAGETGLEDLPFWPVAVAQLLAVAVFGWHAAENKRLPPGQASELAWQFLFFIPWGMLSYWWAHVWPQHRQP